MTAVSKHYFHENFVSSCLLSGADRQYSRLRSRGPRRRAGSPSTGQNNEAYRGKDGLTFLELPTPQLNTGAYWAEPLPSWWRSWNYSWPPLREVRKPQGPLLLSCLASSFEKASWRTLHSPADECSERDSSHFRTSRC